MKDPNGQETLESMSQAVWYNQWTINRFKKYLKGDILEVGCGIGNFSKELLKYGHVWAMDYNRDYISELKRTNSNLEVGLGDIEKGDYFFGERKFDTIVCLNVLEHIKDDEKALQNIYKLLKKDGVLVLLVPAFESLFGEIDRSIGHYRRYQKKQLLGEIEQLGFEKEKVRVLNLIGGIGWLIAGRFFRRRIVDQRGIKLFNLIAPLILRLEEAVEPPIGTSILVIAKK